MAFKTQKIKVFLFWFHSHRNRNVINVFSQTNPKAANEGILRNRCSKGVLVLEYGAALGEMKKYASCQYDVFQEQ